MSQAFFPQPRAVYATCTILSSWLLMQILHEGGHALGAYFTGGTIRRVILVPWELSRTDLIENPKPLIVCWAGPVMGVIFPLVLWLIARVLRWKIQFPLRFLAGFCLITNGSYIGFGSLTMDGDAGELIHLGSPIWMLWIFLVLTAPTGFFLWHGLGKYFGYGPGADAIESRTARSSVLTPMTIVTIESICAWI